ncbi:Intermediate filament [Olea europaea subsp. europaea]|uniref:Intermediate filament n=1 Tax=Olea europaea subsp. europaea TaxID=158383 RepID=A0A8S0UZT2_OLEEU|nr:Intermediate filament [Olea europaea subsp. europaea]
MRRKTTTYRGKPISANYSSERKPFEDTRVIAEKYDWKLKVNSPVVEDAIDQFTRHIVSEWVTNLWYSRITPGRNGPEELVQIINGVLGEISCRMRNVNLIDLLTRDIINVVCSQLELFRTAKTKIENQKSKVLTIEERDVELKFVLAAENKLHPALFSAEAEHKVLQHVMDGLIMFTFRPEDLQCSLFRYIVRELLACTVMRPVINLASPRFINERIESLVISRSKTDKGSKAIDAASLSKPNGSSKISSNFSRFIDPSIKGVELVDLKDQSKHDVEIPASDNMNETFLSKDPLLSLDTRSTRSWGSLPETRHGEGRGLQQHHSGGEWGDMLDAVSRRKTEALAPENFDNMWAKGRNYKREEGTNQLADPKKHKSSAAVPKSVEQSKVLSGQKIKELETKDMFFQKDVSISISGRDKCSGADNMIMRDNLKNLGRTAGSLYEEKDEHNIGNSDESGTSSYTEDEDISCVTGLDSPGVRVWDGKSKRNSSNIHHPLETLDGHKSKKMSTGRLHSQRMKKTKSANKRSRSGSDNGHVWQEVERTSFLLGEGQDLLNSSTGNVKSEDSSDNSEAELLVRIHSGETTSSSVSLASLPESHILAANSAKSSIIADSFFKLRCEVLGANVVKSGSKTFAVYSISVTDVNSNNWSIKRRFRHFEELHRRLKEFPEYNLHLPPKHFLSSGLDVYVIQERCKLLDQYLKKLLQLPTVSCSIEVWDFLSVDSQTYTFSNSLSILETLSVDVDDTARETYKEYMDNIGPVIGPLFSKRENLGNKNKESALLIKGDNVADGAILKTKGPALSPPKKPAKGFEKAFEDSSSDSADPEQRNLVLTRKLEKTVKGDEEALCASGSMDAATELAIPSEWVPPNLSVPILDLVDVIFQLKDGGWIRRKAFWVAKQVLQLGMGDAFDDWLIGKIQLLRKGSVVAAGIKKLEQILWPDGIFITKHPKRQRPAPSASPAHGSPQDQPTPFSSPEIDELEKMRQKEAELQAKFVYELMLDKAPSPIVGLVGHKEYEQCAKDLYYFIQSSVCMKQLAFNLLELLLLSLFPELDYVFRELDNEKEKFGKFKPS